MKKLISIFLMVSFTANFSLADCNFKTDITKNSDGTFTYTRDCHLKVGEMKQDNEILTQQVTEYKKAIELKDLALVKTEERADKWMNTSFNLQDRMERVESIQSKNNLLNMGIGFGFAILAVWGAGQISR